MHTSACISSAATQHITFDEVKCRSSPHTSQMPQSGSRQCSAAVSTSLTSTGHNRSDR
ncbi:hypothetical protein FDG2_0227 [Candidatus Protofrankia californiensis]|uniref:Uncharacterized protein n=1 Tax=Candidatus Protofrankia californiensis TaxID=1839754 RepID=A0A1C3NT55_9ACTN|nr:hypothetical protein FDG2_0227 [Candidatus Protofrankia californiensis]